MSTIKKIVIIGITLICVALATCYTLARPQRIFKNNLKHVIEIAFDLPDKNMDEIYKKLYSSDFKNALEKTESDEQNSTESMKNRISSYCSEKGIQSFITKWYLFSALCAGTGWYTEVKNIDIDYSLKGDSSFKLDLSFFEGERFHKQLVLNGKARANEFGKIEYWNLSDESFLELVMIDKEIIEKSNVISK